MGPLLEKVEQNPLPKVYLEMDFALHGGKAPLLDFAPHGDKAPLLDFAPHGDKAPLTGFCSTRG